MMTVRKSHDPIFVVGVPRSGTTLLAAMLAAHSQLSCGPETRFFHFLAKADSDELLESWPENAIGFLNSLVLIERVTKDYHLEDKQLREYLANQEPSIAAILSALTEQFMLCEEKQRWVEKSPEHLMHVATIRQTFPSAPIIRIVRDPRDAALSMIKTPWAPDNLPEALMLWRKYDENSQSFFLHDQNNYTLLYENLVRSPERELKGLCAFLNVPYEPQMQDRSESATQVVTEKETWKNLVSKPVDDSRINVWKRNLSTDQNNLAEALVGDRLMTYGYESTAQLKQTASVFPSLDSLIKHQPELAALTEQGTKFWRSGTRETVDVSVFVGEPDQDRWIRLPRLLRWCDTTKLLWLILSSKLSGQRIIWLRDSMSSANAGICGRLIAFTLQSIHANKTI